jgi:hypothetical protein
MKKGSSGRRIEGGRGREREGKEEEEERTYMGERDGIGKRETGDGRVNEVKGRQRIKETASGEQQQSSSVDLLLVEECS